MPKQCVYCLKPAGSREHLLNAALGGHRVCKEVTCTEHNEMFSRTLDRAIASDLTALNALAGVVSRHRGTSVWTKCVTSTGDEYIFSAGRELRQAAPIEVPEGALVDGFRDRHLIFSNEKQANEWLAELKSQGAEFTVVARTRQRAHFPKPPTVTSNFGGDITLRAVARIAMNYLARYFGQIARAPSLQPFREFVLGAASPQAVRFDFTWNASLPPNEYPFGHRIAVGVQEDGAVIAGVSFFGVYELAVDFGAVEGGESVMRVIDIDPVAKRPPNDIREYPPSPCFLSFRNEPPTEDYMVNQSSVRVADLLRRVSDRNWREDASDITRRVNEARAAPLHEREDRLSTVIDEQDARVLRLATAVSDLVARKAATAGWPPGAALYFERLFDMNERRQLGTRGGLMLTIVSDCLVKWLLAEKEDLSSERLRCYLEGDLGHRAALAAFIQTLEGDV